MSTMVERGSGDRPEPKPRVVGEKQARPETRRVQLDFSQKTFERLDNLQKQSGVSQADVIRSGLAAVDWVLHNVEPGDPVTVLGKDGKWHTAYFPLHWTR
jgi:hypothetical protein